MWDVPMAEDVRGSSDSFQFDELFSFLADAHRRAVIRSLDEADGPMTLSELAYAVASAVTGTPKSKIRMGTARRVQISLYHVHIPKLESMGIVAVDRDRNTVQASENLSVIVSILERI